MNPGKSLASLTRWGVGSAALSGALGATTRGRGLALASAAVLALSCATARLPPPEDQDSLFVLDESQALTGQVKAVEAPVDNGLGFILAPIGRTPERRFLTVRPREGEAFPAVLVGPGEGTTTWTRVTLIDSSVAGYSWVYVGPVGATRHVFAVLDSGMADLAPELLLLSSARAKGQDAAQMGSATFGIVGRLRKPDPRAHLERVVMDVFGKGRISLRLDWSAELEAPAGLYHYETVDGGRTFGSPSFEPAA